MTVYPEQLLVLLLLGGATLAILVTAGCLLYQVTRRRTALVVPAGRGATDTTTPRAVATYRWNPLELSLIHI